MESLRKMWNYPDCFSRLVLSFWVLIFVSWESMSHNGFSSTDNSRCLSEIFSLNGIRSEDVYILLFIIASIYADLEKSCLRNVSSERNVPGESCPSKMSIFQMGSYKNQEKKPKKIYETKTLPSLESISGSASYGSFITYEKIPSKHGSGGAAIFAPVRRSWRVKNRVVK